jgi:hypothetical protein
MNKDKRRGEKADHESFEDRYKGNRGIFQVIPQEKGPGPAKCKLVLFSN